MAQARKKSTSGKSRRGRGFILLILGVGIGVGGVYLWQLVTRSLHTRGGLAALIDSATPKTAEPATSEPAKKESPKTNKPHYEFYTLLQNETVLPDREPVRADKGAKIQKAEESAAYVLQAGSFATFGDADNLKARLALNGLVAHIQKVEVDGKSFHRVRIGPYDKLEQLDAAADRLRQMNIRALRLKIKSERKP
jgi:cell division protein FtsN